VNHSNSLRRSGILLHITSLPGGHGIGDLGNSAYEFVEFLAEARQKIWQVLPLGPTGYGDSPYQLFSAFGGNPLLIDLEALREEGLLSSLDLGETCDLPQEYVDYGRVIEKKNRLLGKAARTFLADAGHADRSGFDHFCRSNAHWLEDYSLFMACKNAHTVPVWSDWESGIRRREVDSLNEWREKLSPEIEIHKFAQFEFFCQWERLKAHCRQRGIRIMGDVPIYVAHDSADVWAHQDLFQLDENSQPAVVAGVPPDYFSSTGQLWGNPLYR
jgi:4-alpha-glucanotransferase